MSKNKEAIMRSAKKYSEKGALVSKGYQSQRLGKETSPKTSQGR